MTLQLENRLAKRQKQGNFRQLLVANNLIDFASNDYLGLARSQELALSVLDEWKKCERPFNGIGATGSRLLTGNSYYAQDLEEELAKFHGYEAGLLFNCGYMANVGLISSVASSEDFIFFDAQVHASTHDGMRLSLARAIPFRHNDLAHLELRLKRISGKGQRFICIESIYSTDGSKAPLQEISSLAKLYGAHLIVDEAHSVGVWGPQGRGLVAENGLEQQVFAQITTFGKAIGAFGAIILGSHTLKQSLINFARSYLYSTALPFHVLAAIKCSYQFFPMFENKRLYIKHLINHFREAFLTTSETHIQCVKIKGNYAVKHVARKLALDGFDVRPLMSPTVRQGHETLRICLHDYNTIEQVAELVERINHYKKYITTEKAKKLPQSPQRN